MYLSKLRLFGFKSFSNRVEVNFPKDGITSVVGPNGCGKSNIVDAIRWVLGEQKVKSLRSSKMEDVIFSGTATKPPMNMAEVSLIINNDKGVIPGDYSQVMVTRQTYRNGDSAYLINNQPCRLKDIQHLFYDTGMGAASYSLMENNMIDRILSDRDEERRLLFEEASGISKYKKQRDETRRQLDRVSVDLDRVEDNLRNTKHNVRLYERQARKAEKFRDLREKERSLELSYQSDQYEKLKRELADIQEQLGTDRNGAEDIRTALATRETELEKEKLESLEHEQKLSELNQVVANTEAEGARLSSDMKFAQERIKYLQDSIHKQEEDKQAALKKIEGYGEQRLSLKKEIEKSTGEIEELEARLGELKENCANLSADFDLKREEASSLSNQRLTVLEELSGISNDLGALNTELSLLEGQLNEAESSHRKILEDENVLLQEKGLLEKKRQELEATLKQDRVVLEDFNRSQETLRQELEKAEGALRSAENEKLSLETRCNLLKSMQDSREGTGNAVRHLLSSEPERIEGAMFEMLSVPDEYIGLVELCAGESIQTLVAKDKSAAGELLASLKTNNKGMASIFTRGNGSYSRKRPELSSEPGFQGWLIDKVSRDSSLNGLVELLIGQFCLVADMETAVRLAQSSGSEDLWFVTSDGDMAHTSGVVRGGSKAGEDTGLLTQKANLEKTSVRLRAAADSHNRKLKTVREKQEELEKLAGVIAGLQNKLQESDSELREIEGRRAVIDSSLHSFKERRQNSQERQSLINDRLSDVRLKIGPLSSRQDEKEELRQSLDSRFESAQNVVGDTERQKLHRESELREREAHLAQLRSQVEGFKQKLMHLDDSEREQSTFQLKMDLDSKEWASTIEENKERSVSLKERIQALNLRLDEESRARDEARDVYNEKVMALDEIRDSIRELNNRYNEQSRKSHELDIQIEKRKSAMSGIRERIFEVHEVDLENAESGFERVSYNSETVEEEIQALKQKLKSMGNINVGALDDYEEEKARLEDVQKQFDDLEKARAGLKRAIRKLDKVAREQFLETFDKIKKNFQFVFSTLFEGGQAQLRLEEDVDPLDAKIEINGSPSGKKMRGVTLLSGGERALTAISLLFSLYLVRPSPYCIMDEVDGPLDDANIGRFINLLRRFSHETQFIVVTHNKRTMAASDMLYGVTQETKGISQLVSVRLEEASLIAA